jgi:hypothetical protein
MKSTSVSAVVRQHVRLHTAHRILDMYNAGESFQHLIESLSPEIRSAVEGLLRAAAESWGNAVTTYEHEAPTDGEGWLC